MLTQIKECKSFIAQAATLNGKGLISLTHDRANRGNQNQCYRSLCGKIYLQAWEVAEQHNNPQVFVQASGVRYRSSKRKSIEGTFVNKKKLKIGRTNVYKTMHVGLGS